VSSHDDTTDREAIMARRALLLSSALAALSCSSQGDRTNTVETTATGTVGPTSTALASASGTPSAELPAPLSAWTEVMAKAPPLGMPKGADGKEQSQLEWMEKRASEQYQAIEALWGAVPDCDAAAPDCRPRWRAAGERLKQVLDATRGPMVGGCGGANGETASLVARRQAHNRYQAELIARLEAHLAKTAAAFGPLGEQEWQKQAANAKKPPPMPCLSPCMMPEVQAILASVPFDKDASDARPDSANKAAIESVVQAYKAQRGKSKLVVRGHADASETKPADLAKARAKAVADALIKGGIPRDRIETKVFAADYPIERSDDAQVAAANRRVDFEAVPQ